MSAVNWKIVLIGGLAYYLTLFSISLVTGQFIHSPETGVLAEAYRATISFWRPELNSPDGGLFWTMWFPSGLIGAFLLAVVYAVVRPSLSGPGWRRGLKFGFITVIFAIVNALGYRGLFNLPDQIWIWWIAGGAMTHVIAGTILGSVSHKIAPPAA